MWKKVDALFYQKKWVIVLLCGTKSQILNFLVGEYELTVDAKGRLVLPAGYRKQLADGQGDKFVVNRGFEQYIALYTMEGWQKATAQLERLNYANPKAREYRRLFLNGANMVEVDNAGRLLLPKSLIQYADIKKEIVFSTQMDMVEIWNADVYYQYINTKMDGFSDLAEEVAGGDFFKPIN